MYRQYSFFVYFFALVKLIVQCWSLMELSIPYLGVRVLHAQCLVSAVSISYQFYFANEFIRTENP
jgi:hypothetical protein